jgi:YfiH family protein
MEWNERDGVRWLEARLPGTVAAFSTRSGGTSRGAHESLNVGLLTGDRPDDVRENRRRLAAALDREPHGILFGRQVHAADVERRQSPPTPNPWLAEAVPSSADGQATASPELTPLVQVADCLPIALAGTGGVAMLHGGWRGLAAGIVDRGVEAVGARAAAIGPAIGPCCYEVGQEVSEAFAPLGEGLGDGRMLDLTEVARRLLARAGVESIEAAGLCTSCERELFFSHRRDGGQTGRQAGAAWLEGNGAA